MVFFFLVFRGFKMGVKIKAEVLKPFVSGNSNFKAGDQINTQDPANELNPALIGGLESLGFLKITEGSHAAEPVAVVNS